MFFNPLESIIKKIITLFALKIGEDGFEKNKCIEFRRKNIKYECKESTSIESESSESSQDRPENDLSKENSETVKEKDIEKINQVEEDPDFFLLPPPPLPPPKSTFKRVLKPFAWSKSEKSLIHSSYKIDKIDGEYKIEKEIRDHFKIEAVQKKPTKKTHQIDKMTALSKKSQQNIQILLKKMPFYKKGNDLMQHKQLYTAILELDFSAFTNDQFPFFHSF